MKICIVSLERATERRDFMQKQLVVMNEGGINSFKQYSKFKSILFRGKIMSNSERGCFASHYCLWKNV